MAPLDRRSATHHVTYKHWVRHSTAWHGMARHTTKPIARGADSGQRSSCVHFALLVCLFEDFGCVGVNHSAFFEVTQCLAFSVARWLSIHLLTLLEKLSLLHLGRWIKVFPEQLTIQYNTMIQSWGPILVGHTQNISPKPRRHPD